MLKLEKLDKNSLECAIDSYRGGISSVQALNFCPASDNHSWFDKLLGIVNNILFLIIRLGILLFQV